MKKQIDENIAIQISPTKNIEAFQEKSALETLMSLIAEGKVNIPGVDDNVSFLQKLQTEIHTPAKNIEFENQLKHIEAIKHEVEFSAKKTETEKKQLAAQKDAFLKRINNFKEENEKTKAELEEQKLELEAKGKMLLQVQDEIAVKQQSLETKEKLILENSDIDAKLESLATLKEELRLESLKKLEEMREFKDTKDQIKSELDDRVAMVEARERESEEKEMSLAQVKESKKVAQETGEISPEILQSKVVQDMIVKVLMPQIKAQMIIEQQQRDERGDEDDSDEEDSIEVVEEGVQTDLVETFNVETQEDGEVSLWKLVDFKLTEEGVKKYAAEICEKDRSIILREEAFQKLKQTKPEELYKKLHTSDTGTQFSDKEEIYLNQALSANVHKLMISTMKQLFIYQDNIQGEKAKLADLAKEKNIYENQGKMIDEATQYVNENNDSLHNLKLAMFGERSFLQEIKMSKDMNNILDNINGLENIEHDLIMKQTSMSFMDQSILDKVKELTLLNKALEIQKENKFIDKTITEHSIKLSIVNDIYKFTLENLAKHIKILHNTGGGVQKIIHDDLFSSLHLSIIDQSLQTDEIQIAGENQMNLLGQEVHQDF